MKINYAKTPKTELRQIKRTLSEKVELYEEELAETKPRTTRKAIKRLIQNLMRRIERIDKHLNIRRKSRRLLYAQGKIK